MNIRKAESQDIPQIETLLYQVHKVHADKRPDLFIPGMKKYTAEELQEIIADDTRPVYVAEEDNRIFGYAFCILQQQTAASMTKIRTLYIDDLCVDENIRGKHVGSQLYQHVLTAARQMGCYNVTLNVWECNPTARKFYDKCGLSVLKTGMEQIL